MSVTYRDRLWRSHMLIVALVGLLGSLLLGWYVAHWFFVWVFPLVMAFAFCLVFKRLTHDRAHYQPIDVIRQVKRYPANEQWIVLSSDAYNRLTPDAQAKLRAGCRREGIGLLRVSARALVRVLETARQRPTPDGLPDYLVCYARERSIRAALQLQAQSGEAVTATAYA